MTLNKIYKSQKDEIDKLEQDKIDKDKELEFWLPCIFYYKDDKNIRNFIQTQVYERKLDEFTKNLSEIKLLIHGDATRLASAVGAKSEYQVKYEMLCIRCEEIESDVSKLKESVYHLTINNEELEEKLLKKDIQISDLERKLRENESRNLEGIEFLKRISNASSASTQTDDDQEILDLIHNAKEQQKRWYMFSKNNTNKKIENFEKLKKLKTFNQTGFVETEIAKIIKRQYMKSDMKSSTYSFKHVLSVLKESLKRRMAFDPAENELIDAPEFRFCIYEEILSKFKNEKISLRSYEHFIIALKYFKSQDFRVELMRRFVVNDEKAFSEEVFLGIITLFQHLGLSSVFVEDINKSSIAYNTAESIIIEKLHIGSPKRFIFKVVHHIKKESNIYLNGKSTLIPNDRLEYYKLLREIYMTIIGKWNSSVANVFVEAFKLKLHGKERKIMKREFKEFLIKVMKLDLTSIESNQKSYDMFFTMFFDDKSFGFTNLSSILSAFKDKVEIKLPMAQFLFICINSIVEKENFICSEICRLFIMYEDLPNNKMSILSLENVLNKIAFNSLNVFKAMAEARDKKGLSPIDSDEFEVICRKFNIFQDSEYLDEAYNLYTVDLTFDWEENNKEDNKQEANDEKENANLVNPDNKDIQKSSKLILMKAPLDQTLSLTSIEKYHGAIVYDT